MGDSLRGRLRMATATVEIKGALVICNHSSQCGIGQLFPNGELGGRWYKHNFGTVFNLEQGRRWTAQSSGNRICHEFDAYFLEELAIEDAGYLQLIRKEIASGRMEIVGGTYGQAESQVFGYESAIRQLTLGQATLKGYLGSCATTYIVEEQSFFTQLPQLLRQAGFCYASVQFQNSGRLDPLPDDLILWEGPDGSSILTVPSHQGMVGCDWQKKPDYMDIIKHLSGRTAPLVFQWVELWVPGMDWGASMNPYLDGIGWLEAKGFRQMTLSEYIQWAKKRTKIPRRHLIMDGSNYDNNFYWGGWGYENDQITRGSNRCESLLLTAETLCAGGSAGKFTTFLRPRLPQLWSRLLMAQNHDPYLAGDYRAFIDGLHTFQSELAKRQFSSIRRVLQGEHGLGRLIPKQGGKIRLFNPCSWSVFTPVLIELADTVWPEGDFIVRDKNGLAERLSPVFRSDDDNVVVGPILVGIPPFGFKDLTLQHSAGNKKHPKFSKCTLIGQDDNHTWQVDLPEFNDITFKPLLGEWKQVPMYRKEPPNINAEAIYPDLATAPVTGLWQGSSMGLDVVTWRQELMRICDVPEPALYLWSMAFAGRAETGFVEFEHRLSGTIRFTTGKRTEAWRFQVRMPAAGLRIFADSPFAEEERNVSMFYCSRYVRLEWPGRHLLWCPSQNTLFRRIDAGRTVILECTVLDFEFHGTTNWGMRFHADRDFSPARSMRLAEIFHRQPLSVPAGFSIGCLKGLVVDNPNVLITHVFPSSKIDGFGLRVLNASDSMQKATFRLPSKFTRVSQAGLEGKPLRHKRLSYSDHLCSKWKYNFRPWEIDTFCVRRRIR